MTQDPTTPELPEIVRWLMAAGHAAPSADNTQPWRFRWHEGTLSARYLPDDAAARVFGTDRHCEHLTMGAVSENLIQTAQAAGLSVSWTSNPDGPDYLRGELDATAPVSEALKVHPLFKRHTNRLAYSQEPAPDDLLRELIDLAEAPCRLLVVTERKPIAEVAKLVDQASRLRFRTREIHEWFGRVLRFSAQEAASGTGLDVATIDLPPGGRALLRLIRDWNRMSALNHFGMYKLLARIESAKVENCSGVIAVVGPTGGVAEFAAGRLMERAWVMVNGHGLAAQPFYVVTDLVRRFEAGRTPAGLIDEARALQDGATSLPGQGECLHMLLRIGAPLREPIRAARLPLSSVCEGD